MKKTYLLILIIFCIQFLYAQDTSSNLTGKPEKYDITKSKLDTAALLKDTVDLKPVNYKNSLQEILKENRFLNSITSSESLVMIERKQQGKEVLFYSIFFLLLLFGLLKAFYSRYLNNLFRVFFNTSLRQTQLTDQLLQAKLPSLFFNIFFVLTGGYYIYFLLHYLNYIDEENNFRLLLLCIGSLVVVYFVKYIVLKFTGWISGYKNAADTYIFIVFLINKIISIFLIPVIIIMAFSDRFLVNIVVILSFIIIFLMLALRFLRSYSILQNKIRVQRYHFFLYIIGIEILPLLLIYKTAVKLLTNNM